MPRATAFYPVVIAVMLTVLISSAKAQQQNRPAAAAASNPSVQPVPVLGGGVKVNYIRSWDAMAPITDPAALVTAGYQNVTQTTQYVDGLGRPLQTVARQVTPQAKDMVAPVVYDDFGREQLKYLPYVSTDNNGLFKVDPFNAQKAFMQTQFPDEQVFYSKKEYEASPLNRVDKTMAPGNSWAGGNRGVSLENLVNTAADGVRIWNITSNPLTYANKDVSTNIPTITVNYNAGELYKNVTTDELGNKLIEYRNKDGKVVLKKVESGDNTAVVQPPSGLQSDLTLTGFQTGLHQAYNSITLDLGFESSTDFTAEIVNANTNTIEAAYVGYLSTYYIYDDLNQLRFVIPPKAVAQLLLNNWQLTPDIINELCFRYEYDARKRMIAKKVPGAGWVYMIYDVRNRLIFTQDANQRDKGLWAANLYDDLNRPVMTGILNWSSGNPDALQQAVTTQTASDNASTIEGITVNKNPIPSGATFVALTKTYYDNYSWTNKTFTAAYNGLLDAGSNLHVVAMPSQANTQTMGLVTGSQVRVLTDPNNLSAGNWLTTVSFYDDRNRVIQTHSQTIKGNDILTNLYDFAGKVLCSYLDHTNSTGAPTSVRTKTGMEYDHAGRVKKVWKMLNDDGKKVVISENEYDELGKLKSKKLGHKKDINGNYITDPLETLDYSYNIRGWLTGINKDYSNASGPDRWFGMEVNYDRGFDKIQYNGNVAGTKWRSKGDGERRAYGYTYDKANRILGADFTQFAGSAYTDHATINFDMQIGDGTTVASAYDENGNIKAMKQWGLKLTSSQVIDDLQYTYFNNGNKLSAVTDNAPVQTGASLGDFTDNNTSGNDYGYDGNGNMIADKNKKLNGIADMDQASGAITYNQLNLPWQIQVDGGNKGTITYIYDAAGTKLQKITFEKSASVTYNSSSFTSDITTTTSYVNGTVYESKAYANSSLAALNYTDKLQFMGHEEGRIRYIAAAGTTPAKFEYDYFIKDNLGNVRMVLTEEQKQDIYPAATLEGNLNTSTDAAYVEKGFYNINSAYVVNSSVATGISTYQNNNGNPPYNNNPNSNATANSARLYQLNATTNKTGLGMTLKVMTGDQINIFGKSYWFNNGGNFNDKYPIPVSSILDAFLATPTMAAKGLTTAGISTTPLTDALNAFRTRNDGTSVPWAYVNWIFFDEQFNYAGGGFDRIGGNGVVKDHNNVTIPTLTAPKNGYVFVYCSNESQYNVFFDNMQVIHTRGPLLEETHYYPWGLTMAGISSKAANTLENKLQFLGKEKQSAEFTDGSGLDMYDLSARFYDAQIGRFGQIDPLADYMRRWSPYVYGYDNPARFTDRDGMSPQDSTKPNDVYLNPDGTTQVKELETVTVTASKKSSSSGSGWFHGFLDVVGMIDPTGIADGLNAVIYLAEGNYKDAALSAIGMLPLGDLAKGLKYVDEAEEVVEGIVKYEDEAVEIAEKNFVAHGKVPCGCFLAGTLVLSDSSYKPIELIKPGDKVWAYNDTTHTFGLKTVVRVFEYVRDTVYRLHIGNELINTTSDHPFFIGGRWLKVTQLNVGDSVTTYKGNKVIISAIDIVVQRTKVHNFEVADYHTYYVSAQQVLVHNSGPCDVKLPESVIVKQDGVTIEHYYHGIDHGPAHAHVYGKGTSTKIGQNGKPLDGSPELSAKQQRVVEDNKAKIRRSMKKIMQYHRHNNKQTNNSK
ncbi:hypothetical protein FAM09_11955 [Niastella caeni]|uniref:Hint domain-containing protein n=1 Tax=Niastella caeni TaxID=2569763 RepID=A0A4S8I0P1_9BACT|nr:DUF6443 domain-containing protein [Niastella caeni]THU39222.1 hypothetical protein FAM09_11955 [Niastella caeni]